MSGAFCHFFSCKKKCIYLSRYIYIYLKKNISKKTTDKVVGLVGGGGVINMASPSSLVVVLYFDHLICSLKIFVSRFF